jgi:hypothetical protein
MTALACLSAEILKMYMPLFIWVLVLAGTTDKTSIVLKLLSDSLNARLKDFVAQYKDM